MEYKLLTGFSIQDYNVIFNILSISHDNIKILPLKYCSTIILTTNAQFWEFKYNENTKKSTEFNNKADDEKKEERRQGRNRGKERREQRDFWIHFLRHTESTAISGSSSSEEKIRKKKLAERFPGIQQRRGGSYQSR